MNRIRVLRHTAIKAGEYNVDRIDLLTHKHIVRSVENCPEGWSSWAIWHILIHPNHLRILKASNKLCRLAPHRNGSIFDPGCIVIAQELDIALQDIAVVGAS